VFIAGVGHGYFLKNKKRVIEPDDFRDRILYSPAGSQDAPFLCPYYAYTDGAKYCRSVRFILASGTTRARDIHYQEFHGNRQRRGWKWLPPDS
jgi:hypothetical protein